MPNSVWQRVGHFEATFRSREEGSHLKEYIYKFTDGTGKYEGASGGGT